MSLILILDGAGGARIEGEAPARPAPQPRTPPNQGQGDSRKRIVPVVKPPEGPSAETWEGGAYRPLSDWLSEPDPEAGVLLQPTDDPVAFEGPAFFPALIAVDIHRINDGRGYSLAHLLRRRGYQGRLRAVGAVTADQVFALAQAGFNEFALRADQEAQAALEALSTFKFVYAAGLAAGSDAARAQAVAEAEALLKARRPDDPLDRFAAAAS